LEVCLVFMLCILEFAKYCSLLFDTNVSKESIYYDINAFYKSKLGINPMDIGIVTYILYNDKYTVKALNNK
jgi:hypothetical protein